MCQGIVLSGVAADMRDEVERLRVELTIVRNALGTHVMDNAHRMGALGAQDLREARAAVDRALAPRP